MEVVAQSPKDRFPVQQWVSNFGGHQNNLEDWLNHWLLDPVPGISIALTQVQRFLLFYQSTHMMPVLLVHVLHWKSLQYRDLCTVCSILLRTSVAFRVDWCPSPVGLGCVFHICHSWKAHLIHEVVLFHSNTLQSSASILIKS